LIVVSIELLVCSTNLQLLINYKCYGILALKEVLFVSKNMKSHVMEIPILVSRPLIQKQSIQPSKRFRELLEER
jgi:hypothetical protein